MKVMMSIKPVFVEKIFNGEKRFEFRRSLFKDNTVKSVIIYASSPIKKVVGEFEIVEILSDSLNSLWEITRTQSGITKNFYDNYFHDKEIAYALKIGYVKKYETPRSLSDYNLTWAPQSFCYITTEIALSNVEYIES